MSRIKEIEKPLSGSLWAADLPLKFSSTLS
jgi:hypothetical protein